MAKAAKAHQRVQVISTRGGNVTLVANPSEENGLKHPAILTVKPGTQWWEGDTLHLNACLGTELGKRLINEGVITVIEDADAAIRHVDGITPEASLKMVRERLEVALQEEVRKVALLEEQLSAATASNVELQNALHEANMRLAAMPQKGK